MSHHTKHFFLECLEGYFICATGQGLTHLQAAYRAPFLDALHLTLEVWAIIAGSRESSNKTTREWEEFILQAQITWHALQETIWRGSQGWGITEGSEEGESSSISCLHLPNEPTNFKFEEPQEFGKLSFNSPGKREGGDEGKEEEGKEEMEETE